MSGSDWGTFRAASRGGLIAGLLVVIGIGRAYGGEETNQVGKNTGNFSSQVGAYYHPSCAKPSDRDTAEYCAEHLEAEAAEDQAGSARTQIIVGIFGIAAVFGTLVYSASAASAARDAARAAKESAIISRQDHERNRARIIVLAREPNALDGSEARPRLGVLVPYDIRNTGVAAATIESIHAAVLKGNGKPPTLIDLKFNLSGTVGYHVIGGDKQAPFTAGVMPDVNEALAIGQDAFFLGAIRYRDPTLGSFVRGFCFWGVGQGWVPVGGERYHFDVPWSEIEGAGDKTS